METFLFPWKRTGVVSVISTGEKRGEIGRGERGLLLPSSAEVTTRTEWKLEHVLPNFRNKVFQTYTFFPPKKSMLLNSK